jgi:hypothetical protein
MQERGAKEVTAEEERKDYKEPQQLSRYFILYIFTMGKFLA